MTSHVDGPLRQVVPTYTGTIYVGFKNTNTGEIIDKDLVVERIQKYVDTIGLCVTVTDTDFVYTNGSEPGIAVGFINYPRFPEDSQSIRNRSQILAFILMKFCNQYKVSIVYQDITVMLLNDEMKRDE